MQDFEALGRYVTAEGEARKFSSERDGHLKKAKDLLDKAIGGGHAYNSIIAYNFDPAPIQELITKAVEAHGNMLDAVNEANLQAGKCGKPKLEIRVVNW